MVRRRGYMGLKDHIFKGTIIKALMPVSLCAGLWISGEAAFAASDGYVKTGDYTSMTEVESGIANKNPGCQTGYAYTKTLYDKEKVKTIFTYTIKEENSLKTYSYYSFLYDEGDLYSKKWDKSIDVKPLNISKDAVFIVGENQSGTDSSKERLYLYKYKNKKYKAVTNISTNGSKSDLKKCIKKFKKKYKIKKLKNIKFKNNNVVPKTGQTGKSQDESIPLTIADFDKKMSNFSFNMLKQVLTGEDLSRNVLISPDSIATALAMTENGAAGATLEEFKNVLAPGMEASVYNENLSNFNKRITSSGKVVMHIADSIWVKDDPLLKVKESFINTNKNFYSAETYKEPFTKATVDKINGWVNENTNKMIPSIINDIDPSQMMFLINALAFEGKWAQQFYDSAVDTNGRFTNFDGTQSTVNMMSSKETYYINLKDGVGFLKYYEDFNYAFVGVLPPAGTNLKDYIATLSGEDFISAILTKKNDKDVYIKLPEFKYDYGKSIKSDLGALGLNQAFTDGADFSGMTEADSLPLKIDDVIHKTHIELDRNGTRAAAVTVVIMKATSAIMPQKERIDIVLDRPFLYGIVDTKTGLPVFIGTVSKL